MKRRSIARTLPTALAAATLAFGIGACSTTKEPPPAPAPAPQPESEFSQPDVPDEPVREMDISEQLKTVYFNFDSSEIRGDARPILRSNAEVLRRVKANVVIEGYCDERGSEEYNLALGELRAHSVKKYLGNLGVSSSQMTTVSYGETRPAVAGHTEAAYARNRRVEFRGR